MYFASKAFASVGEERSIYAVLAVLEGIAEAFVMYLFAVV